MLYPMNLSLDECISDIKGAKAGVEYLMTLPLSEYYKECQKEYKLLIHTVSQYFPPSDFKIFPHLYLAEYVVEEFQPIGLSPDILYAPIKKHNFNHEAFAFSMEAFLDVIDEYLPEDPNYTRYKFRKNWKCYMDCSINQVVKYLLQNERESREQMLDCFTGQFLGSFWEYNESA